MVEAAGPWTLATPGPIAEFLFDGDNDEDGARYAVFLLGVVAVSAASVPDLGA